MTKISNNFDYFYQVKKEQFKKTLQQYIEELNEQQTIPDHLRKAMIYVLDGEGKRMRPVLSFLGFECCRSFSDNFEKYQYIADKFSLVLELIHCYSLVHDDLPGMDNDSLRRGRKTCHIVFDEATAILVGDSLLNQAFEVMLSLPVEESHLPQLHKAMKLIANSIGPQGMIGGQAEDMQAERKNITLEQLQNLHFLKTGKLLLASLLVMPTFFGIESLISNLEVFAKKIGLLYQVVDDILEVTKDSTELGKNQTDIDNDKSTFVKLLGLEKAQDYANNLLKESKESLAFLEEVDQTMFNYLNSFTELIVSREK